MFVITSYFVNCDQVPSHTRINIQSRNLFLDVQKLSSSLEFGINIANSAFFRCCGLQRSLCREMATLHIVEALVAGELN